MGGPGDAPATILIREGGTQADPPDPVYGAAMSATWRLLGEKATPSTDGGSSLGTIDFGFEALGSALQDLQGLEEYLAPRPDAPILLPSYLDLLCQTAPTPFPEPAVQPFLHGKERGAPDARVVWRADLAENETQTWSETIGLCPPSVGEMLAVPLFHLRRWLATFDALDEGADAEGVARPDADAPSGSRPFLLWRGRDRSEVCRDPSRIAPNDIVVVPVDYPIVGLGQAGISEGLGEGGVDLWELARRASGQAPALRLNKAVLGPWLACPPLRGLLDLAASPVRERGLLQEGIDAVADYQPTEDEAPGAPPSWLVKLLGAVRHGSLEEHPGGGLVLFARERLPGSGGEPDLFADDDDLTSASDAPVPLEDHTADVERAVKKLAAHCLPPELSRLLLLAARWHDAGKLDDRFQSLLHQGDELVAIGGEALAKSGSVATSPARRRTLRGASGLPGSFRHEMLSVQLAERYAVSGECSEGADLVLHLIASHHGHARPFAPISPDPEPPAVSGRLREVAIELSAEERRDLAPPHRLDAGIPERFWSLNRRYGWWGLAYVEAILRLADWYGSQVPGQARDGAEAMTNAQVTSGRKVHAPVPSIELPGLDGANPLGFLAALGTVEVARQAGHPRAKLGWRRSVRWTPVLNGARAADAQSLSRALAEALRGSPVPEDAEEHRDEAQRNFDAAKKAVKEKREEIKRRGLRGKARTLAVESEILPLEEELHEKRQAWLATLRTSVARPELAIGRHIDCTDAELRAHAQSYLDESEGGRRETLDLLAAFGSDACVERSGRITATPFCFITGSGHQYFLDTARQLLEVVTPGRVHAALFEPWTYRDERLSMRWDPAEDRRYALMDRDPTASDNKSRTVWMANLLGYRALSLFPSAPGQGRLATTGWGLRTAAAFTWPLWEGTADPDTIRSLLQLWELTEEDVDQSALRARGIAAVFRARRMQVGNPPLHKINFSPARAV
jgi:CRISPR-associated endonuclease Cas3-HD